MCTEERRSEFERFYRDHQRAVVRAAARLSGSEAEAWDLAQDTFERAYRSFGAYRRQGRGLAWLTTIMNRLFIDRRRLRRSFTRIDEVQLVAPAPEEPPLWSTFNDQDLTAAIARLPLGPRALLEEHTFAGTPYVTLAASRRVRVATVGSRLYRIRKALRAVLLRGRRLDRADASQGEDEVPAGVRTPSLGGCMFD
jgi:RNA polymerase sigma-70 factor (ECF subfamily)